jgi:predicted deacylase
MGGLLRIFRADGALVRAGEVMAAVSDPFGEEERDILAPFDGLILGRAVMPVVNEGDAVFHLGRVASVRAAETAMGGLATQLDDDPMFDEDEII